MEALLPEVPLPSLALVDEARVSPVRACQGEAQGVGVGGDDNEVNVIWHQAIGENLNACGLTALGDPVAIGGVIGLAEECLHAAIATLSNMVGNAWNDNAG